MGVSGQHQAWLAMNSYINKEVHTYVTERDLKWDDISNYRDRKAKYLNS
jgi:hypothetical protein